MENVIRKAKAKFGMVLLCAQVEAEKNQTTYKLVIERDLPAIKHLAFMTIAAVERGDAVDFFHGHYDLHYTTALKAGRDFANELDSMTAV